MAMALVAAMLKAAYAENAIFDFYKAGGKPRRQHVAGAYGRGLRRSFTQKNLARRANGKKMVA